MIIPKANFEEVDGLQACRKRGAWGDLSPTPGFDRSVYPISTKGGGHIMPTTLLRATPDFQTLQRPWTMTESYAHLAHFDLKSSVSTNN